MATGAAAALSDPTVRGEREDLFEIGNAGMVWSEPPAGLRSSIENRLASASCLR